MEKWLRDRVKCVERLNQVRTAAATMSTAISPSLLQRAERIARLAADLAHAERAEAEEDEGKKDGCRDQSRHAERQQRHRADRQARR